MPNQIFCTTISLSSALCIYQFWLVYVLSLIHILLLLVLVGLIVKKLRILNRESEKAVSSLLVNVLLPCNIIQSFLGEITISAEFVKSCILAILIAACIQIVSVFAGKLLFHRFPQEKQAILRLSLIHI